MWLVSSSQRRLLLRLIDGDLAAALVGRQSVAPFAKVVFTITYRCKRNRKKKNRASYFHCEAAEPNGDESLKNTTCCQLAAYGGGVSFDLFCFRTYL